MKSFYYRNPRLIILTISLIVVAGLSSFMVLPRMEDPLLTERIAIVNTRFPGADAERVESQVTEKLEEELQEIDEIKEIRSISRSGISTLTIELRDDVYADETDAVWSRVRDKLDDAERELPTGAWEPDFDQLDMKAYALLVSLSWTQDTQPNYAILRRLTEQLEDQLRGISGTEKVDVFGEPNEEILVEIDPQKLASLGMTVEESAKRIQASDAKVTAGQLRGKNNDLLLEVEGELDSLQRIERIPLRVSDDGSTVLLGQIAKVEKTVASPSLDLALIRGKPALVLGVLARNEQRLDYWMERVQKSLDDFERQLPSGIKLTVAFEQNQYVEERLGTLLLNLLIGAAGVMLVIFILMGWRSAILVGVSLPLSALMVLAGMRFLGIPIHQMSVTGLIIALGLLIDNAIVMVDDVRERLHEGNSAIDAVSKSVGHLAIPLLGSTLTTAFAFAPIALMPGPAGEFVGSIAISVILAIASSLFLALTIVPSLTAMMERANPEQNEKASRWWQKGFSNGAMSRLYRRSLEALFARPYLGIVLGIAVPLLGFVQARHLPEQFFPPAERDQFYLEVELPATSSMEHTQRLVKCVRERIQETEQVASVDWFLGQSSPSFYYNVIRRREATPHYAQAMIRVKEGVKTTALIRRLQADLDQEFPESRILVRQLEQGPPFDAPVEVQLYGPDRETLRKLGEQVRLTLSQTPDVIHIQSELSDAVPKLYVDVEEDEARLVGLGLRQIASQLNHYLEGLPRGSILEGTEELPVRVRVEQDRRREVADLASLDLVLPGATPDAEAYDGLPLESISHFQLKPETASISHIDGRRVNEIKAYITAGILPDQVLSDFRERLAKSDFKLPPGYTLEYGGETAKRQDAVGNLMANIGVLFVLMVATLVLSFHSFRIAGMIGLVAILSVGLGLASLWVFGYPFGFMAIVGTMGLIGVAINDAIVVIAAIRENEAAKQGDTKAITDVVIRSTRHVVATSLTTIAGFLPLVLSGGGFWPPLAIAIAGGVGGATLLALYFAPSLYLLLMRRTANYQS